MAARLPFLIGKRAADVTFHSKGSFFVTVDVSFKLSSGIHGHIVISDYYILCEAQKIERNSENVFSIPT